MILMIDNYDSFTYNIVQYFYDLGQEVVVKRNDEITIEDIKNMEGIDAIVISPGPCTPTEAGISVDVIKEL
jgi:anthranilate synthase component 2